MTLFSHKDCFEKFPKGTCYWLCKGHYSKVKSIMALMPIIKASSITVIVVMGKLKTSPRHAHLIFLLLNTVCNTPTILTLITIKVTVLVIMGLNPVKNATPKASSVKAYT